MDSVYIVEHSYEYNDCEEAKLIGVFSTEKKAKEVVDIYKKLPGFKDFKNNFFINNYQLDSPEWKEGFVSPTTP